ncbi:MAG TPA: LuxR C-terminal-related transcriptional regulator [Nakamurella sp.]
MATLAVLAWHPIDPADRDTVERYTGRIGRQPGVAYFPGAADALRAATHWQQREHPHTRRAIAVTLAELDPAHPDGEAAVALTHRLAETGHPGTIIATEIVKLLIPEPDCGTWAAAPPAGPSTAPIHELLWREAPAPLGVVVAEDAAIIRAGIVSLLRTDGMDILGEAADYDTLLATVRDTQPRLLITDIRMPPGQGDEGLRAAEILRAEQPRLSVLVLSQHVQASAAALLLTGQTSGIGYLLKERVTALDEFLTAARTVAHGGTVIDPLITQEMLNRRGTVDHLQALADRERDVLDLMAQGLSNTAIAERMSLSTRTVESHVRSIMTKLDLWEDPAGNRRVQAVIRWLDQQ